MPPLGRNSNLGHICGCRNVTANIISLGLGCDFGSTLWNLDVAVELNTSDKWSVYIPSTVTHWLTEQCTTAHYIESGENSWRVREKGALSYEIYSNLILLLKHIYNIKLLTSAAIIILQWAFQIEMTGNLCFLYSKRRKEVSRPFLGSSDIK